MKIDQIDDSINNPGDNDNDDNYEHANEVNNRNFNNDDNSDLNEEENGDVNDDDDVDHNVDDNNNVTDNTNEELDVQNNDDDNSTKNEDDEVVIDQTDDNCNINETNNLYRYWYINYDTKTYNDTDDCSICKNNIFDTTPEILFVPFFQNSAPEHIFRVVYIKIVNIYFIIYV